MIMDSLLLFSDAQAVTADAASTNVVDFGAARDLGVGEELYFVTIVDVALTDASSNSTVAVTLEGDSTDTFTPDSTYVLYTIPAVSAIGYKAVGKMPPGFADKRYLRLKYVMANGDLTTGSFTSFITHDPDQYKAYADNITIS